MASDQQQSVGEFPWASEMPTTVEPLIWLAASFDAQIEYWHGKRQESVPAPNSISNYKANAIASALKHIGNPSEEALEWADQALDAIDAAKWSANLFKPTFKSKSTWSKARDRALHERLKVSATWAGLFGLGSIFKLAFLLLPFGELEEQEQEQEQPTRRRRRSSKRTTSRATSTSRATTSRATSTSSQQPNMNDLAAAIAAAVVVALKEQGIV